MKKPYNYCKIDNADSANRYKQGGALGNIFRKTPLI
jgi:hypothetical protein